MFLSFLDKFRLYRSLKITKNKLLEKKSGSSVKFAVAQVNERKAFDECEIWIFPQLKITVLKIIFATQ